MTEPKNETAPTADTERYLQIATDITVRLGLLFLIAALCFRILAPFLEILVWAFIIAIAMDRFFERTCAAFGGRRKLVAGGLVVATLIAGAVPGVLLTETLVSGSRDFADRVAAGTVEVPPPPDSVADWPVVGTRLHAAWDLASVNFSEALSRVKPQLVAASRGLLAAAGSAGVAIVQLVLSVIIASFLLVNRSWRHDAILKFMTRMAPTNGARFTELAFSTIQSVVQGLLGVAIIQAILAGIGFLVAGIPGAGLWALIVMVGAIVQIPVTLVIIPPVLIGFSVLSTPLAIVFTVWCVVVSLIDNVLKPILFGRGAQVPTIVIFLGAIGGMLSLGIIGLFLGAVILALGYELVVAWMGDQNTAEEAA